MGILRPLHTRLLAGGAKTKKATNARSQRNLGSGCAVCGGICSASDRDLFETGRERGRAHYANNAGQECQLALRCQVSEPRFKDALHN